MKHNTKQNLKCFFYCFALGNGTSTAQLRGFLYESKWNLCLFTTTLHISSSMAVWKGDKVELKARDWVTFWHQNDNLSNALRHASYQRGNCDRAQRGMCHSLHDNEQSSDMKRAASDKNSSSIKNTFWSQNLSDWPESSQSSTPNYSSSQVCVPAQWTSKDPNRVSFHEKNSKLARLKCLIHCAQHNFIVNLFRPQHSVFLILCLLRFDLKFPLTRKAFSVSFYVNLQSERKKPGRRLQALRHLAQNILILRRKRKLNWNSQSMIN